MSTFGTKQLSAKGGCQPTLSTTTAPIGLLKKYKIVGTLCESISPNLYEFFCCFITEIGGNENGNF